VTNNLTYMHVIILLKNQNSKLYEIKPKCEIKIGYFKTMYSQNKLQTT